MKVYFLCIFLCQCAQEIKKPYACVTYYTQGKKTSCQGSITQQVDKLWCENVTEEHQCEDVESCFIEDYVQFNKFRGRGTTCQNEAYLYGCGKGVFTSSKENCP